MNRGDLDMNKEIIIQILNTLNLIEIKGINNINYMCGVMNALQKELNNGGDNNGLYSNNLDK